MSEPITYSFAWTVPEDRVWRDLHTLDLRIRPDGDALTPGAWVRWEEESNTFSLCQATDVETVDDPSSGQCGAGIPAADSSGTLESGGATLFMADTVARPDGAHGDPDAQPEPARGRALPR